jgi:hypothetical protein
MSLSVNGSVQQSLVYQLMQPRALSANSGSPAPAQPTAPTGAASSVPSSSSSGGRSVAISDTLAAFLSGLFSGGPLAPDPAQNPMSPAIADSSSATPLAAPVASSASPPQQAQTDVETQTLQPADRSSSAAASSLASYGSSSGSSSSDLGVVLAAYVSNMEPASSSAEADPANGHAGEAMVSASAAAVTHPGGHAQVRDHASSPVGVSAAAA